MDGNTLEKHLADFNKDGSKLTQFALGNRQPLGLVETWRVLRPVKGVPGAFWVMSRDIGWVGANEATHVMKVLHAIKGRDNLTLITDNGEFLVEFLTYDEAEPIRGFRTWFATANIDESIQAEALVDFVNQLEAEAHPA